MNIAFYTATDVAADKAAGSREYTAEAAIYAKASLLSGARTNLIWAVRGIQNQIPVKEYAHNIDDFLTGLEDFGFINVGAKFSRINDADLSDSFERMIRGIAEFDGVDNHADARQVALDNLSPAYKAIRSYNGASTLFTLLLDTYQQATLEPGRW